MTPHKANKNKKKPFFARKGAAWDGMVLGLSQRRVCPAPSCGCCIACRACCFVWVLFDLCVPVPRGFSGFGWSARSAWAASSPLPRLSPAQRSQTSS